MKATRELLNIIESFRRELEASGFVVRAFISNTQIFGAIKTYVKGVNPDAIVAMIDNSLSNDGKEGIVFTTSAIYFSIVETPDNVVQHAMLRYEDIVDAQIVTSKTSDYSNVVCLKIRNLPYEYYKITSKTIKKTPFANMINDIKNLVDSGYIFETDHEVSLVNVRNYLQQRDTYMKGVLDNIRSSKKPYNIRVNSTDALGLTPLHYCIALRNYAFAEKILKTTMKKNADMYLKNQPYGIYNYCMSLTMTGDVINDKEKLQLFKDIYLYSDELAVLEKRRKRAKTKETVKKAAKEVGQFTWDYLNGQAIKYAAQRADYIAQRESEIYDKLDEQASRVEAARRKVDKDPMNYGEWIKEKNKLDRMQEKADEIMGTGASNDYDDYEESYEDYDDGLEVENEIEDYSEYEDEYSTYEISADDGSSLVDSEQIREKMLEILEKHIVSCKERLFSYDEDLQKEGNSVDPRFRVIKKVMSNEDELGNRLNADFTDKILICIKYKYFLIPSEYLDEFPELKCYVCREE